MHKEVHFDQSGVLYFNNHIQPNLNILGRILAMVFLQPQSNSNIFPDLLQLANYDVKEISNKEEYLAFFQKAQLLRFVCNKNLLRSKIAKEVASSSYPWYVLEIL